MLNLLNSSASTSAIVAEIFSLLIIVLICMPLHEFAHGWAASLLGDDTAEKYGRLTLNPFAHIDIMGIIALALFGIGWARPVPINPSKCTKVKPKAAMAITAFAGPLANFLLAYLAMIIGKVIFYSNAELINSGKESVPYYLMIVILEVVTINIYLGVFNLLMPFPPFDGSRIFLVFLPNKWYFKIMKYERIIMLVIMVLMFLGVFTIPMMYLSEWVRLGMNYATGFVDYFMGAGI